MAQSHREASRRLFEIAELQQGFFTTKQAKAAGFAENTHPYHVQVGNWIREHRGIYRLALFPMADRPDLVLGSETLKPIFTSARTFGMEKWTGAIGVPLR